MAIEEIKVSAPKVNAEASVNFDFGDNLEDAVAKYGSDVVFGYYKGQAVVRLQAGLRTALEKGIDAQTYANQWKPGVSVPSIAADPLGAATAAISRMTDDEKAALLAKLMGN